MYHMSVFFDNIVKLLHASVSPQILDQQKIEVGIVEHRALDKF